MNGGPWWVKAIGTIGVPSAIAIYLVWALSATIPTQIHSAIEAHERASATRMIQQAQRGRTLISLLQQVCLNTAESPQDRRACVQTPMAANDQ